MSAGASGGTPLSILIKIDGVEAGQAVIKKLAASFKEVQAEADATSKKATEMGAAFQKAGDSGKGVEAISGSLDKVNKSGTAVTKTSGDIKKGFDATKTSASGVSTEIAKTAQSFDKSKTSTESAVGSYQKYNSEGQKIKTTSSDMSGSIDKVGTSTKGTSQSFNAMALSTGDLVVQSDKGKGSVDALGTAHTTLKGNVEAAKGGLDAQNNTLVAVDQSTVKTTASTAKLGSTFMTQVGSATALVGSAVTLWQTYDALGDAQLKVDKATNTLHASQIKVQSLQAQLNKLTLDGKTGTEQYAIVQDKLQLAHEKVTAQEGTLQNAQEDLNVTYSHFAQNIIPQIVTVFGSFTSLLASSRSGMAGAAGGITGIGSAASVTNRILSMISLTNPFFIALVAGGAIVGAFVTNLFGFRDAVNAVGVALGNALPMLKPLLDLMGAFGQGVVDTMGMGEKSTQSFADTTDKEMGGVGTTLEGTQAKYIDFSKLHENILKTADGQVIGFRSDYLTSIQQIADGMPAIPSSVKSATDESAVHFDEMVLKAQQARNEIAKTFSKTVDLGGGDVVTGLPGEGSGFKTPPTRTAGQLLGSTFESQSGAIPESAQNLKTLTVQDPKNQQTYMNIQKLKDEMKLAGIEAKDMDKIMAILNERFHATNAVGVTTSAEFGRITQAQIDARRGILGVNDAVADSERYWTEAQKIMGLTGATIDTTAQSTQGLGSAIPPIASAFDAATKAGKGMTEGIKAQTVGEAKLQGMLTASSEGYRGYTEILGNADMMSAVMVSGINKQNTALAKGQVDTLEATSASQRYTEQLVTAEGAGLEFGKGLLAGNDILNQTAASALQTAGQVYYLSDSQNMANMKAAAFSQGMQEQALALKNTQVATEKTEGTVQKMKEQWVSGEAQSTAFNSAVQAQALAFETAKVAVSGMEGTVSEMQNEYALGEAQTLAFNTAVQAQALAFEQSKLNVDTLKGTLTELIAEWNSGEAASMAFNTAFQEQEIQATKNLVANEALKGTYSALIQEYDNGITTFNAVNKGFMEQEISIYKTVEAADQLRGTILAMNKEWEEGSAQLSSFIKGYYDQEAAFRQAAVSAGVLKGTIAAIATELKSNDTELQNSIIGFTQMQKTILDSVVAYQQATGGLDAYSVAMQAGLPQAVAYQGAILKTQQALMEQETATAALNGTTVELIDELGSAEGVITRYNAGFAQGYSEITKWAGGIEEAIGKNEAMQRAIVEVADKLSADLPEGFRGTIDSAKEWIEISKGVPETMNRIAESAAAAGKSLRSGIASALMEGDKEQDKAFDDFEKKTGIKLNKSMKNALQESGWDDLLLDQFGNAVKSLESFKGDPAALSKVADTIMNQFEGLVAKHPALEAIRTDLQSAIEAVQLDPTTENFGKLNNVLGRVQDEIKGVNTTFKPLPGTLKETTTATGNMDEAMKLYIDTLGNIDITKAVQDFKTLTAGAEAAQKAIRAYNDQNKVGLNEMYASGDTRAVYASTDPGTLGGESITQGADIGKYNQGAGRYASQGPLGGGAAAQVDLTAQTAAVNAFIALVATIPAAVQTAVTGAQAAFNTLNPLGPLYQSNMVLMTSTLSQFPAAVQQQMTAAQGAFNTLNPQGTLYQTNMTLMLTILQQFPAAVQQQMATAQESFNTLNPLGTLYQQNMTLMLTILQQFPAAVTQQMGLANAAFATLGEPLTSTVFPKLQTDSATAFAAVTNIAGEEAGKIPPLFETAASDIDTALQETQNTSATTFEAVVNIGEEEANKLGPLFETAASDIDTALQEVEQTSADTFDAVTTSAEDSGESITQAFEDASSSVVDALGEMESTATDTFQSIVDSAEEATSSVEDLVDAIDQLEDKDITITTHYETTGTPSATGFGPTIVDHPRNLTVGEAGPEYVSVIPLSSSSAKNLSPQQRLQAFGDPGKKRKNPLTKSLQVNNASPYSNYMAKPAGSTPMALGTVYNNNSNSIDSSSDTMVIGGPSISSFSNSIDRFSSSIEKQSNLIQQTGGDTRNIFGGSQTNNNITRNGNELANILTGGGNGGRAGGGFDGLVAAIREALIGGFSKTNISLTSNTILDSQKINESQSKLFGIRNGAALK